MAALWNVEFTVYYHLDFLISLFVAVFSLQPLLYAFFIVFLVDVYVTILLLDILVVPTQIPLRSEVPIFRITLVFLAPRLFQDSGYGCFVTNASL